MLQNTPLEQKFRITSWGSRSLYQRATPLSGIQRSNAGVPSIYLFPRWPALGTHWQQAPHWCQEGNTWTKGQCLSCELSGNRQMHYREIWQELLGKATGWEVRERGCKRAGCSFCTTCQTPASQHPVTLAEETDHSSHLTICLLSKTSLVTSKSFRKRMAQRSHLSCKSECVDQVCRGEKVFMHINSTEVARKS